MKAVSFLALTVSFSGSSRAVVCIAPLLGTKCSAHSSWRDLIATGSSFEVVDTLHAPLSSVPSATLKSPLLQMEQAWTELPNTVFVPLVGLLSSVEIKSLRSVCKNWRQDVDAALSGLTPRNMHNAEVSCFCSLRHSSQHDRQLCL